MLKRYSIPPELILIVEPDAKVRVVDGKIEGEDVAPLVTLLESRQATIEPLYGISEDEMKERTASTESVMGEGQKLDLSIFYKVSAPVENFISLAGELRQLTKLVQAAYIKPAADLPFIFEYGKRKRKDFELSTTTPDFTSYQRYLKPASEGGINAEYAWKKAGGFGDGIKVIDIEGAWRFSHEDLVENPSGCVAGVPVKKRKWRTHGTSVLGMLGGDHNDFGIAGICPKASVRTISIFDNPDGAPSKNWGSAAAIRAAADMLGPGDIMLIELHRSGPAANFEENEQTQFGYIPVEWWPCDMGAILYATERGVLVVEAAGNGQQNLSAEIYDYNPQQPNNTFPSWWRNPFRRDPVDTRAILVGAGLSPIVANLGPDCSRWELSNYGAVVDTQAWGMTVATCGGDNDLTPDQTPEDRQYTSAFNGTSSASAMMAGLLTCVQGVLRTKGKTLAPIEARSLLHDPGFGCPQVDGPLGPANLEPIGPRPDLLKLLNHLAP